MPLVVFRFSSSLQSHTLSANGTFFGGSKIIRFPTDDVDKFDFPHLSGAISSVRCMSKLARVSYLPPIRGGDGGT